MALNSVRLACCPVSTLGWAGSARGLFQHLWGSGDSHREDAAEPGRPDGGLSLRLEADAGGLEKELAGLMDGDLAVGKVRPARVPRGGTIYARNPPQAPRIGRHLTPHCTDGKTEAQRENTMTKIVPLFQAAAGLYSGPPCLPEKGVRGDSDRMGMQEGASFIR